jgi:hypothetical protein
MESSAFQWQLPGVQLLPKFSGIWQTTFTPESWIFEIRINFDWSISNPNGTQLLRQKFGTFEIIACIAYPMVPRL